MTKKWSIEARFFTLGLLTLLGLLVAWWIRDLFQPIIGARLIAYLLDPFVELLQHRVGMKRKLAANLVYFLSLAIILATPAALLPVLDDELRTVAADLFEMLDTIEATLAHPFQVGLFTVRLNGLVPALKASMSALTTPVLENTLVFIESISRNALWALVVLVGGYYFLTEWDRVREWLIHQAPSAYRTDARRLYLEIKKIWVAYLRSQLTLMAIVGVVFTILWAIIGLPGALILGILAGLFTIIPDVGPFVGGLLAVVVALLEGSTWLPLSNFWFGVLVAALAGGFIGLKNIWLRPRVFGRSVNLNEGLVFVSIVAAVIFTGIVGAFIVVPVLASAVVIVRYLKQRILGLPPFPAHHADLISKQDPPERKPLRARLRRGRSSVIEDKE